MATGDKLSVVMESRLNTLLEGKTDHIDHGVTPTDMLSPLGDGMHRCQAWTNRPPWDGDAQGYVMAFDWLIENGHVAYGRRLSMGPLASDIWENICSGGTWWGWRKVPTAADLLNKANNSYGALSCVNILEWATRQTQSGPFVVDPSVTTEGLPERGRWYTGRLDIGAVGGAWTLILMGDNVIHTNGTSAGIWSGWVSYYADRPLQWHDLPLALGIGGTARYGKDRLGLVHLMGQVTGVTAGVVFATLPVQYRPSAGVAKIVGQSRGASDIGASRMDIGVSGNLAVGASTNPAGLAAWLDISCSFPV